MTVIGAAWPPGRSVRLIYRLFAALAVAAYEVLNRFEYGPTLAR